MNNNLNCKWCNKQFKRKTPKNKHEKLQLCIPIANRTICTICNITFSNIKDFKIHLTSKEHIKMIICDDNDINIIREKQIKSIDIDPYLNNTEKNTFSTLGNNITLTVNNNNTNKDEQQNLSFMNTNANKIKLNLNKNTDLENEIKNEQYNKKYIKNITDRNNILNKGYSSYQELIENKIYNKPTPNNIQENILRKLIDLNDEIYDDKKIYFLQILKNISINDADFMTSYIRDCIGLNLESKQIYLELINKFIKKLIELYNLGYKEINNTNIADFISKLSK